MNTLPDEIDLTDIQNSLFEDELDKNHQKELEKSNKDKDTRRQESLPASASTEDFNHSNVQHQEGVGQDEYNESRDESSNFEFHINNDSEELEAEVETTTQEVPSGVSEGGPSGPAAQSGAERIPL
jgi:hypothetical protein